MYSSVVAGQLLRRYPRMGFGALCRVVSRRPVAAGADPDRLVTLSVIDARRRFGVWVAALADDGKQGHSSSELVADALSVPSRPRLALSQKSMTAIITDVDAN